MNINNIITQLDVDGLAEILFIANTPTYLFRNFRKNISVEQLAKKYSTDELVSAFETIVKKTEINLKDYVGIYAIFISFIFKNYYDIISFLKVTEKYVFKWREELRYIILANTKSEQVVKKTIESYAIIKVKEEAI